MGIGPYMPARPPILTVGARMARPCRVSGAPSSNVQAKASPNAHRALGEVSWPFAMTEGFRRGGYEPPAPRQRPLARGAADVEGRLFCHFRRGRWSGLPLSLPGPRYGPPRQAAAQLLRSLFLPQAALPCRPHRPALAAGGSVRRQRTDAAGLSASGGALFTAEKSPKRAGGCGPRTPMGPRGVHPKKRHLSGR